MIKRESFIFYKSFYDSIKELTLDEQVQIYNAIFKYEFEGELSNLKGTCKSIFTLIIPQLEANNKRYLNGKKGGAPKGNQNATKKQPKNNQKTTKKQPNENDNVNVNENDNVNNNKHIYGEYKHVRLKDSEYEKLKNDYDNYEDLIKYLDEYIEMKGYKAKSHYLAIKKWVVDAVKEKNKKDGNVPIWFNKDIKTQEITKIEKEELDNLLKEFE